MGIFKKKQKIFETQIKISEVKDININKEGHRTTVRYDGGLNQLFIFGKVGHTWIDQKELSFLIEALCIVRSHLNEVQITVDEKTEFETILKEQRDEIVTLETEVALYTKRIHVLTNK